ncbi:MgtC/SapB family protein [Pseudomonas schmalbachii]|uniref:MgtC/SapB family protein n=1 Tax=Pseudomonas schmalbachii TaxID=2816993 RepID=A0ABS3TVR8_9PSED|nr:MgtC/SapB family protein [Pseudomonas schmalbachii]MBO3277228.1 MgtC/SapB family protein [Pseudomonas schmalbachii]
MPDMLETLLDLSTALSIGLLVGTERGWRAREEAESRQIAGIRTYALTGLLGGFAALLASHLGPAVWVGMLVAVALLAIAGYLGDIQRSGDQGMTSEIAMFATFILGSLAMTEGRLLAAGGGIVVALLLSLKEPLQAALKLLDAKELSAILKLLFISVVLLPVLPNQGYGPWEVFNPYATWWMVVLIAGLGFVAYLAIRIVGTSKGLLLTAVVGSIVSSTAMTITLSHLHERKSLRPLLACGLLATSAMMFPRVLLEVSAVNPALLGKLLAPLLVATLVYAGGAFLFWRRAGQDDNNPTAEPPLKNPFELMPALRFAALLALILFLVEAARHYLGDVGVYLVALISGLADVDAITLSLSSSARIDLDPTVATHGIALAALSNSLVKGVLIAIIGGSHLARLTFPVIIAGLLAGGVVMLML